MQRYHFVSDINDLHRCPFQFLALLKVRRSVSSPSQQTRVGGSLAISTMLSPLFEFDELQETQGYDTEPELDDCPGAPSPSQGAVFPNTSWPDLESPDPQFLVKQTKGGFAARNERFDRNSVTNWTDAIHETFQARRIALGEQVKPMIMFSGFTGQWSWGIAGQVHQCVDSNNHKFGPKR